MTMTTEPSHKRKYKSEKENKAKTKQARLQCEYLLPNKHFRRCNMTRRADARFCAQHREEDEADRVKCPLDPGHTVRKQELERHLKKCNAARRALEPAGEPWFSADVNVLNIDADREAEEEEGREVSAEEYKTWITYVNQAYSTLSSPSGSAADLHPLQQLTHASLEPRLSQLSNKKHAIQQSSLIAHLEAAQLLACGNFYVEFGCGRGELSRYLNHALVFLLGKNNKEEKGERTRFLLVDRDSMRLKLDNKIIADSEEAGVSPLPQVERLRVDIKDLDLVAAPKLQLPPSSTSSPSSSQSQMVAVSKHLCGAATDLTLQCLAHYAHPPQTHHPLPFAGALIALCCRHRCTYATFPVRHLPHADKVTRRGFTILTKMSSWAVCGRRRQASSDDAEHENEDEEYAADEEDCAPAVQHPSGLPIEEREEIGFKVRAVLDHARVQHVRGSMPGYEARLVRYVERGVSFENVGLLVGRV
ncbi:methyltransferase TRM13-domain-containing protein [Myxozyma melibiosi]|uniref:tRNA:m(4)X modification enzyme TRM13 n=1 Tax=Myxozyma melibiosi TaxID=54550 RepID=A0ABR1FFG0_9ASCO